MNNYDDICYECGAYGDDYYWDEETQELLSNCPNCWVMQMEYEDDD